MTRSASGPAAVATPSGARLVPCVKVTGIGSAEPSLGITKDGSVFVAPVFTADGVRVIESQDRGVTWSQIDPGVHGRAQPYLYVDVATDRLFFASSTIGSPSGNSGGFDLTWSADASKTWTYEHVEADASDWTKIYAGPPVTSTTSGYPNVVYMSAPSPVSIASNDQVVYKSLDGGSTWAEVNNGGLSTKASDVPNCPASELVIYGNGVVGPDGTVYISLRRCGGVAVAVSKDEGATFTVEDIPGATMPPYQNIVTWLADPNVLMTEPLAVDSDGNLYVVWPDAAAILRLSVSKDHGATWSAPVVISEPSVRTVRYGGVAVKSPGTIAIAYYGTHGGMLDGSFDSHDAYDGYIAESTDALTATPTFVSAIVNDPATPLFEKGFDSGYARLSTPAAQGGGDLMEIVQVKYAPNGDIWAAFNEDMCPGAGQNENCEWDLTAHADSPYQAVIGHLVHR